MSDHRAQAAQTARAAAADLARSRVHPDHRANGDEERFRSANHAMTFTKGLAHDATTGLVEVPGHVDAFRAAIDGGHVAAFTSSVPFAPLQVGEQLRPWEAPTAGYAYDLQGPDAQAVTMPPAPAAGSDELCYELAEVYELALIRDQPLTDLRAGAGNPAIADSIDRLNGLDYPIDGAAGRARARGADDEVDEQTVFRGSSPGVDVGPYLSQFLLIGTADQPGQATIADGRIRYGPLLIDQRVPVANPGVDWMRERATWLTVQNGVDVRDDSTLFDGNAARRFITTPRDLATYVHDDALYQAYLNACLILLAIGSPFDPSFDALSGHGPAWTVTSGGVGASTPRHAGGFALYGGPHILTLVCEVATRALKAVRFQKFNTHLRLRPETLAGRLEYATEIEAAFPTTGGVFSSMADRMAPTLQAISAHNPSGSRLLPMAFQEGSPMHPSYGAGHAAVAGACVTVLKAFFDTDAVLVQGNREGFHRYETGDAPIAYVPDANGDALVAETPGSFLTLEHELNKLAANISIGRNMAGVHYYSDYFDSLRLGEEVAIGMLEEQALCYPTDPFVVTVPTFDGDVRRIGA
ncbi:MAG: bromoperoxidase [Actinomycetota bacterium]